jgi:hypothetical protein
VAALGPWAFSSEEGTFGKGPWVLNGEKQAPGKLKAAVTTRPRKITMRRMKKNPAQSRFLGEDSDRIELPGRTIYLLTNIEIRSDEKNFHVALVRQIFENDKLVRRREWKETVPRMFN